MHRLPILIVSVAALAALPACSKKGDSIVAGNATAPAGFVPPTALNRSDFATRVEKRFAQLDADHDSTISKAELPSKHRDLIASFDANGDGKITKDEFTKGSFARFDKADINHDGVLTGEERRSASLGTNVRDDAAGNASAPAGNTSQPIGS